MFENPYQRLDRFDLSYGASMGIQTIQSIECRMVELMTEFTTDVDLQDIAVRDPVVSSAVDEPSRAMILDMLADREMTINEIHDELSDRGFDRTENTVRHHVNELRDVGLVEVTRLEERRGGTTKYYRSNTIVLSYELSEDAIKTLDPLIHTAKPRVADLVSVLREEYEEVMEDVIGEMAPCQHCKNQKYETYLLLTVVRRAFVRSEANL